MPRPAWLPPLWVIAAAAALLVLVTAGSYLAGVRWAPDLQAAESADPASHAVAGDEDAGVGQEEDGGAEDDPAEDDEGEDAEEDEDDAEGYPEGIEPDRFYVLENVHSGLAADVQGVSASNYAAVHLWSPNGQENQQFQFVRVADNSFEIVARHSDKVVQAGGRGDDGESITQLTSTGDATQHWAVEPTGDGAVRFVNRANGQALHASGDDEGAVLQLDDPRDDEKQLWRIQPAG